MAEDEGSLLEEMSTPKKVVTGAAVGLATAAAVGVGKKLLGSDDSGDDGDSGGSQQQSQGRSRSSSSSRRSGSSSRSGSKSRSGGSSSGKKSRTTSSRSTSGTKSRSSSGSSRRTTSGSASRSTGGATRTKDQLYAQAKRLKIEGRSSMNKAQLERAVERAKK